MLARVTILLCLLAVLAPAAAVAQDNPFAPLPPASTLPEEQPTTTSSSTSTTNDGLKSWQEILIFLGGGVLLLGIGYAILSDARHRAPTGDETETKAAAKAATELEHKRRKAKARAAGKRARAARKRNR